jgi:D-beta-D-heptose 7-phosphate kinase/D-beta-D-heptose 1-phosphate adenosyltransferase
MNNIINVLSQFRSKRILVIGDVMLDHYIYGKAERISPEAPIPVIKFGREEFRLGGAANVAANIASLSGKVTLVGAIGNDAQGEEFKKLLKKSGIDFIPVHAESTIQKTRIVSEEPQYQQHIRLDREETSIKKIDLSSVFRIFESFDLIVISDYAKGMINPGLVSLLKKFARENNKKIIVDPKPANIRMYSGVFLITPNEKEAIAMASLSDVYTAGESLRKELSTSVLVTRGKKGMSLFNGSVKDIPTYAKEVVDVSGAGDTAIAALALGIASGLDLEEAAILSNHAAGISVSKHGTSTVSLLELERQISSESGKVKSLSELKNLADGYRKDGKKIVWTNGFFDLLHSGHIRHLRKAREFGDCLIVGINSDDSARLLKGFGKLTRSERTRAEIVSSLEFVDWVLIFHEQDVTRCIETLKPDFFIKGGNYNLETIHQGERRVLESYGSKIIFLPLIDSPQMEDL